MRLASALLYASLALVVESQQRCPRCYFLFSRVRQIRDDGSCRDRCVLVRPQAYECGSCDTAPTSNPSSKPSYLPTQSPAPSQGPSPEPSIMPTRSVAPSGAPVAEPTRMPVSNENIYNTDLDLSQVADQYKSAFVDAANRWDSVIVGDIPPINTLGGIKEGSSCDANNIPNSIDDIHICAEVTDIDGVGGVLGQAGAEYIRTGSMLPITASMTFDKADIDNLVANGEFDAVILHEIGHCYGISSYFWTEKGITSSCKYDPTLKASAEWQSLTGCPASEPIPVETDGGGGTACSHFDEECLKGELMTGYLSGDTELSRMTIGTLEDLGYEVDYSQADPFPVEKVNPSCVCDRRRRLGEQNNVFRQRPNNKKVKDVAREAAIAYGKQQLKQKKAQLQQWLFSFKAEDQDDQDYAYAADQAILILYQGDDGSIQHVEVHADP